MCKRILFLISYPARYNENKPVTSSRDTQEIQPDVGAEMLRIFKTSLDFIEYGVDYSLNEWF